MWQYRGQVRPAFAEEPGPGQESVWDYPRPPRLVADPRHVVVSAGERALADSRAALRLLETASPPTFYLPVADVNMHELAVVPGSSVCEWKGAARYFALRDGNGTPVAFDYPHPAAAFISLSGHICFYPGRVACLVDAERVRPQDGGFYAGWITDDVVGPFKGAPGTSNW